MPTLTDLLTFSTLTDVDFVSGLVVLRNLDEEWVFFAWYHDANYGNDEYGCTSLPNIFHNWLMKRSDIEAGNDTHINVLGNECTDFVCTSAVYVPSKKILILAGYHYTSDGNGYPAIYIIDVSDPANPTIIKHLQHSSAGATYNYVYYSVKHDKILIGVRLGDTVRIYYGSYDEVLNANNIDDLPYIDGYRDICPIDEDRVWVLNPLTLAEAILDLSTMSVTSSSLGVLKLIRLRSKIAGFYKTGNNTVGIKIFDLDLNLLGDIDTGIAWTSRTLYAVDNRALIIAGTDWAVVDETGIIAQGTLSKSCLRGDRSRDGFILCTPGEGSTGTIRKLTPDTGYKIVKVSDTVVQVLDLDGNPVANKTVYVAEVRGSTASERNVQKVSTPGAFTELTTDSEGKVDLSSYAGKTVVIIVPP